MSNTVRVRILRDIEAGDEFVAMAGDIRDMFIEISGQIIADHTNAEWDIGSCEFEVVDERAEADAIIEAMADGEFRVQYLENANWSSTVRSVPDGFQDGFTTPAEAARAAYRILCEQRKAR